MKVKDLIAMETDIDVCDDYDESCWIAMCGPIELTEQGKKEYGSVLEIEVDIITNGFGGAPVALLKCGEDEETAEKNVKACKEFFFSAAGYCSEERWNVLFVEP